MTTIAANRKMMAADRKVTDENGLRTARKIVRVGDAIVGCAGTCSLTIAFLAYLEVMATCDHDEVAEKPRVGKDDSLSALILTPLGLFVCDESFEIEEILDDFYAVGTGAKAALAAMHLGCSPIEAVEIACRVDPDTGGPIDVMGFGVAPGR